jgi:predicted ester cyclase
VAKPRQVVAASVEAFNAHDEEGIRSLYANNVILQAPGDIRLEAADAVTEYMMGWLRAFPDAQITIETEVANGDWVAHRLVFEGTHEDTLVGPEGEIPATHRRLKGEATEFLRVQDGKIVEDYLCFDQAQVLTQLGLMPELAHGRSAGQQFPAGRSSGGGCQKRPTAWTLGSQPLRTRW